MITVLQHLFGRIIALKCDEAETARLMIVGVPHHEDLWLEESVLCERKLKNEEIGFMERRV
jgi:hypothetical protein